MSDRPKDRLSRIADLVEGSVDDAAPDIVVPTEPPKQAPIDDDADEPGAGEANASGTGDDGEDSFNLEIIEACARLDQSDTDNGMRLRAHFGADLAVLETEGMRNSDYVVWNGRHWDQLAGNDAALRVAQRIGARIIREADYIALPLWQMKIVDQADGLADIDQKDLTKAQRRLIDEAEAFQDAVQNQQTSRRKFGVTSKNKQRLDAMLACAAPHLTRKPDQFNADPMIVATATHTLRFKRIVTKELDLECPDPEVTRYIERREAVVEAIPGHRREDFITRIVDVAYNARAKCPQWEAFLAEFLPDENVRRMVQIFSGLGLTGLPIQKVFFHYGNGANGKSVFLEVLSRLLGLLAVGLPSESLLGDQQRGGQNASPDLARLYGARFVRVLELKEGESLREDLVKKLTGGEKIPVRNLFRGFFDFQPTFKAQMSGNGYPRIDGTDNGIWRRMTVIHWPVTIPEERQRNFEEVVGDFNKEWPGILNWLVEGVLIYLREGLVVPDEVRSATNEFRDEMDPIGRFVRACVETNVAAEEDGYRYTVTARDMYDAYCAWSDANGQRPWFETKFGRVMKTKIPRDDGRIRSYLDCRLHDVPAKRTRSPSAAGGHQNDPRDNPSDAPMDT